MWFLMSTDKELFMYLSDLEDEIALWRKELEYHECFLSWMNLWDEFIYFRTNAHLEQNEDEPFLHYTL